MDYFLIFTTALVTSLLLVPPIKHLAKFTGVMDEPNERKVHTRKVPRLGGLAIFFGVLVTYLIYLQGYDQFRGIFVGMLIMVIVGILDDCIGLEPKLKLLGQIVAALAAMIISDVNISSLGGILGSDYRLGMLSWPLTLFWIVGITNAINLSDGLDGLASGISLIAFASFGVLAYQREDLAIFAICLVLIGSILGFLKYNTHPAEVFMGDTGSLFLGYSLGTISLAGNFKSLTTMTLLAPIIVLLVPICDTAWAVIRRIKEGRSPFSADKKHFHHELLNSGMDQSQTVSVIYAISAALSICAVALANSSKMKYFAVPMLVLGVIMIFSKIFGIFDLSAWATRMSKRLDRLLPFHLQSGMSTISFRLVQVGATLYILAFGFGLPFVSMDLLLISTITMMLVLYLVITRGQNGHSFIIFSFFFLAITMILVTERLLVENHSFGPIAFRMIEPFAFGALVLGVFGKIIFKQRREIFLSTPLELFIFLALVTVAMVPPEIQAEYGLVRVVLRTFVLFLGLKIITLTSLNRVHSAFATSVTALLFICFGVLI